ncbi:ATP-dependent nuclease [Actinosynnema sp. CS-041913]|uniref:ATP-dependent nuclease n=1 Tax=Actinosynnema sp. CS-041913 TaxID=3239917 RepID=UPI003D92D5B8
MDEEHQKLARMMVAQKFEPFIRHIRFPHFRNIREGTQIEFTHPITALVGPNGTNKTAILRALQGCPDYYNVGNYWFSTSLDTIDNVDRHRFIHGYLAQSIGEIVEVIKTRIVREENPDYFEPSRPLLGDGMKRMPELEPGVEPPPERTKTRWKAIQKHVTYLDFRSELSAYDKFFFHVPYKKGLATPAEKKAFIRRRAGHMAESLNTGRDKHKLYSSDRVVEAAKDATEEQRLWLSRIIGRDYSSVRIMAHNYLDVAGSTVILRSHDLRYSEAFAGSGEFAAAILVKKVTEAPKRSLILLDEPEVSLHPGAQRNLMEFLVDQVKKRNHQVVISTHAPEIIKNLPSNAIKVLQPSTADGKVELVAQTSYASEAFFRLGVEITCDKVIYVEDRLAAALVKRATRPLGPGVNFRFEVRPIPGGAANIRVRFIPALAIAEDKRSLVLLDGDQYPGEPVPLSSTVADADLEDFVQKQLGGKPVLALNGQGNQAASGDRPIQLRKVLSWLPEHVGYLPGLNPDALLLQMEGRNPTDDPKGVWVQRTTQQLGRAEWEEVNAGEILSEQERALASIDDSDSVLESIRTQVQTFLERD